MLYSSGTKILCPLCVNRVAGLEATKIRVYKSRKNLAAQGPPYSAPGVQQAAVFVN